MKLSTNHFFVDKVCNVAGLYLDPPAIALVLSVDEKTQCQAPERSQPALPLGLAYVEGYTHDYLRHGTTTLFAALDVAKRPDSMQTPTPPPGVPSVPALTCLTVASNVNEAYTTERIL